MSCNSAVTTLYALRMIFDVIADDDDDVLLLLVFACVCC